MEIQSIQSKIHTIRGQKVMLDFDLAALYEVQTRVLKQLVRRNAARFPDDFMFALSHEEISLKIAELEMFLGKELADIKEVLLWLGEENQARADAIAALENQEKPVEEKEERRKIGFRKG